MWRSALLIVCVVKSGAKCFVGGFSYVACRWVKRNDAVEMVMRQCLDPFFCAGVEIVV